MKSNEIRAGFLANTNTDAKAINPFGFVAVAALVGMFSDKAILKLGDVFNALFQPAIDSHARADTAVTWRRQPMSSIRTRWWR